VNLDFPVSPQKSDVQSPRREGPISRNVYEKLTNETISSPGSVGSDIPSETTCYTNSTRRELVKTVKTVSEFSTESELDDCSNEPYKQDEIIAEILARPSIPYDLKHQYKKLYNHCLETSSSDSPRAHYNVLGKEFRDILNKHFVETLNKVSHC
jgi:hypothetical protein